MQFIKRAPLFLIILFSLWYAGLFGYFNQGAIAIEVPYLGNFRIAAALAIMASFVFGAIFASAFFGYDSIRKSMQLRKNKKTISSLETSISKDHEYGKSDKAAFDEETQTEAS